MAALCCYHLAGCLATLLTCSCIGILVILHVSVAFIPMRSTGLAQIYASYNYRRDLADVVRIPGFLGRSRQLGREEARSLQVSPCIPRACLCSTW